MLECLDPNATYLCDILPDRQADVAPESRIRLVCRYISCGLRESIVGALQAALRAGGTDAECTDAMLAQLARIVVSVRNLPASVPGCDSVPQSVEGLRWVCELMDLPEIIHDALRAQELSRAERGKSRSRRRGGTEPSPTATAAEGGANV